MTDKHIGSIDELLQSAFQSQVEDIDLQELFAKKLVEYDLSKTKVIAMLNIDKNILDGILDGSAKQPSLISILKIAQFLEIGLNELVSKFLKTQSAENISAIESAKKATFIVKNFDIKKLRKVGFLDPTDSVDHYLERILTFFGYNSIYDYETSLNTPLFSKSKRRFTDKMKTFWIKSAYQCFEDINNPNEYDRDALKDLIVKIKPYSQDVKNGLLTVCKALYNIGITVIVQNQLATTQIYGGTFLVKGKPCIVLTDLYKSYSTIWFTLIHELHHVLYDLDTIATTQFHLTGDPDLYLIEEKADEFAIEYFGGIDQFNFIKSHINNPYLVKKLANETEVHECMIYANFRHFQKELYNKNFYGAFQEFFPDYTLAVKHLNPITWKENSIPEIAQKLKKIFEINM